jgi:hypothetical protein
MIRPVTPSDSSSKCSANLLSIAADERFMGSSARYPAIQSRPLITQPARQKVLDLIDQKHEGRCVLKHSNCPSFEFMEPHGG